MGTGGTISGVGRYLKERNSNIRMIGVDPVGSLLLETWQQGHVPNEVYAKTYKVEGIGEDFLPSTLDLSVIDEVIQIGDKDSFLWARRLVREEGIFCGGSSGTAIAAAMRYAQDLTPNRLVVVILPDSGSRYLSKFYDDKWMKENSFLETEWSRTPLDDVLAIKSVQELISVRVNDRMTDVIALLKAHDISQVPVLYLDGTLAGLVTEVDLLKHMLENSHVHSADETVAEIVSPTQAIFPASAPIDAALPAIMDGQVALITRENQPVGILTKIDLLDYIAQTI